MAAGITPWICLLSSDTGWFHISLVVISNECHGALLQDRSIYVPRRWKCDPEVSFDITISWADNPSENGCIDQKGSLVTIRRNEESVSIFSMQHRHTYLGINMFAYASLLHIKPYSVRIEILNQPLVHGDSVIWPRALTQMCTKLYSMMIWKFKSITAWNLVWYRITSPSPCT